MHAPALDIDAPLGKSEEKPDGNFSGQWRGLHCVHEDLIESLDALSRTPLGQCSYPEDMSREMEGGGPHRRLRQRHGLRPRQNRSAMLLTQS